MDGVSVDTSGVKKMLDSMLSSGTMTEKQIKKIIKEVLKSARNDVYDSAGRILRNDPRGAQHSVRWSAWKNSLGGTVTLAPLRKARGKGSSSSYTKKRTLKPGQRGGNRIKPSADTIRMESYNGVDRTFILNFFNAGAAKKGDRESRYGNRGRITARRWFKPDSERALKKASEDLEKRIEDYFKNLQVNS